ncbi:MAG TPA: universal stress protein [Gaiellaceae bacterium]|nr:universal stress protein [Gaiellaceae bacterium]
MIVVGVDGSEHAKEALRWTLREAALRKCGVLALYGWTMSAPPGRIGYYAAPLQDPQPYQEGAEGMLKSIVDEAADAGDVVIELRAVQGSPAEELIRASEGAELLVVGSRGLGGFASLLLGSVSQQCAQHAACPVVIVRE